MHELVLFRSQTLFYLEQSIQLVYQTFKKGRAFLPFSTVADQLATLNFPPKFSYVFRIPFSWMLWSKHCMRLALSHWRPVLLPSTNGLNRLQWTPVGSPSHIQKTSSRNMLQCSAKMTKPWAVHISLVLFQLSNFIIDDILWCWWPPILNAYDQCNRLCNVEKQEL